MCLVRMVTIQTFSETTDLVASSARGFVRVDPFAVFEQNYPCKVQRCVMDISSLHLSYAMLVNTWNTAIKSP